MKILLNDFFPYFDGKTHFFTNISGLFFFWGGGGGEGVVDKSPRLSPVKQTASIGLQTRPGK